MVPGGFRWFCPDSKSWIPAVNSMPSYVDFIHACKLHCIANNLPIGLNFEAQIQDQLCATLDGDWCQEGGFPLPPRNGWGFSVETVVQGSHRLAQKMIQAKARRVPSEVATERAMICASCQFNQAPEGCSSCNVAAMEIAADAVATGASHPGLRSCKISGFSLRAKINVPQEILDDILTDNQIAALPQHCWLK